MNNQETVALTRLVKAICPQQAIDAYTPDAWHPLLSDLTLADCQEAARNIGQRQPFMAPSEIRAEVRRIRTERIERSVVAAPPPELLDDPRAYQEALRANIRNAADGLAPPVERAALPVGTGPEPVRENRPPASLRTAFAEFRRRYGVRHPRRAIASGPDLARKQLADSRGEDEGREAS